MPAIEIDYAMVGSHVPPTFTATGTFVGNLANITCRLMRIHGTMAMQSSPPTAGANPGEWKADFTNAPQEVNLTLRADIAGAPADSNEQPGIIVEAAPPLQLDP